MDPLHVLPPEVLEIVLQCIDIKSVITASEVCQEWHDYIQNTNSLWKIMCMKYCNHCHLQQDRKEGMSWQVKITTLLNTFFIYLLPVSQDT